MSNRIIELLFRANAAPLSRGQRVLLAIVLGLVVFVVAYFGAFSGISSQIGLSPIAVGIVCVFALLVVFCIRQGP